jgi:hypothetical protein
MPKGLPGSLFPYTLRVASILKKFKNWLPPQVPGDAHDASGAEAPVAAAAALGSASEGSRRFHSGSEVPELYGVFVCCRCA